MTTSLALNSHEDPYGPHRQSLQPSKESRLTFTIQALTPLFSPFRHLSLWHLLQYPLHNTCTPHTLHSCVPCQKAKALSWLNRLPHAPLLVPQNNINSFQTQPIFPILIRLGLPITTSLPVLPRFRQEAHRRPRHVLLHTLAQVALSLQATTVTFTSRLAKTTSGLLSGSLRMMLFS